MLQNAISVVAGVASGAPTKTASSMNATAGGISADGAATVTQGGGAMPVGMNRLAIGAGYVLLINGHIRRFMYLPQTTSAANLAVMSGTL